MHRREYLAALACTATLAGCQRRASSDQPSARTTADTVTTEATVAETDAGTTTSPIAPRESLTEWPSLRAGPGLPGSTSSLETATGLSRTWTASASGHLPFHLSASGPVVYAAMPAGPIRAFSRANGDYLATFLGPPPKRERVASGAVVAGSTLYAGTFGSVTAIDAATGATEWRVATGGVQVEEQTDPVPVVGTPAAADGTVFCGGLGDDEPVVRALDAETGDERWRTPTDAFALSGFVVADGVVYAAGPSAETDETLLLALDAASGETRWTRGVPARLFNGVPGSTSPTVPSVIGETVCVPTGEGRLAGFDRRTGERSWSVAVGEPAPENARLLRAALPGAAHDGRFVTAGGSTVTGIDAATGETAWTHDRSERYRWTFPAVAGDRVVVAANETTTRDGRTITAPSGQLLLLDATTGERLDAVTFEGYATDPVVADEQVVVGFAHPGGANEITVVGFEPS